MKPLVFLRLLLLGSLSALALAACGGDDDETAICEEAWDAWCACPTVSCSGRPESCTGPDKTWAECINAAADACTASCD